ncbi:unnamed protein product [Auanema sp. JU1783]|nr:unnamed protein product [Auanema sp. JU1783]
MSLNFNTKSNSRTRVPYNVGKKYQCEFCRSSFGKSIGLTRHRKDTKCGKNSYKSRTASSSTAGNAEVSVNTTENTFVESEDVDMGEPMEYCK